MEEFLLNASTSLANEDCVSYQLFVLDDGHRELVEDGRLTRPN
jgi:hypothetical protein